MKKNFPGQNLCSGAFGGNIRPCTKQRAGTEAHFWNPPPPSFAERRCHPPPPPAAKQFSGRPVAHCGRAAPGTRDAAQLQDGGGTCQFLVQLLFPDAFRKAIVLGVFARPHLRCTRPQPPSAPQDRS